MADINNRGAAADRADTGQWRLEATFSRTGARAVLHAIGRPEVAPRLLMDVSWPDDPEALAGRIQNAVYDNPQVLDDYSALIVIDTPHVAWVPVEVADSDNAEESFTAIYPGTAADVMRDTADASRQMADAGRPVALYSLAPGLKAFLARTFPGARVRCAQALSLDRLRSLCPGGEAAGVFLRPEATDIILLRDGALQCAATRPAMPPSDTAYHLLNAMLTCGLDPAKARVPLFGDAAQTGQVADVLSRFCGGVETTNF